jgi:hypothetical protein
MAVRIVRRRRSFNRFEDGSHWLGSTALPVVGMPDTLFMAAFPKTVTACQTSQAQIMIAL